MRAREFINETRTGKISNRHQSATVGLNLYTDASGVSSNYTMNRLGMALASTDGTFVPDIDSESWIGTSKSAHPYTREEQEMLKMAYAAVGAKYQDLNNGDLTSGEPPGGNDKSTVIAFKGYPR